MVDVTASIELSGWNKLTSRTMLRGSTSKQHQDQRLEKDSEATFFTTGVATVKSLDCDVMKIVPLDMKVLKALQHDHVRLYMRKSFHFLYLRTTMQSGKFFKPIIFLNLYVLNPCSRFL